jgi:hypothetical protein
MLIPGLYDNLRHSCHRFGHGSRGVSHAGVSENPGYDSLRVILWRVVSSTLQIPITGHEAGAARNVYGQGKAT